ncbi:MAG TPA: DUF4405 domain-containing protein [Anaerolineales bacterium]|nr:DUF4405 domain-containing protein [Anaerolineales bacterium]HNB37431.1 DUF4405 domain-containing protein [Anaerolineales bacterium]
MNASTKTNLVLDLTIFSAFLAIASPKLTGNTIHEWLAVAFGAAIVAHLLFHWKWLVNVTTKFFHNLFNQSRLNFVVDLLFFLVMTATLLSGLMISKDIMSFLGIQLNVSHSWESLHRLASDASVVLLGIHFALHWKWLVTNIGRYIVSPVASIFKPREQKPVITMTLQTSKEK